MSKLASGVWNGHVTGEVTWPWKVNVVTRYIWMQISWKRLKIETRYQWVTNRKGHVANRLVRWPMTSRDLERSNILWPIISSMAGDRDSVTMSTYWKWLHGVSNGHVTGDVTWPWKVNVVTRYIWMQISREYRSTPCLIAISIGLTASIQHIKVIPWYNLPFSATH